MPLIDAVCRLGRCLTRRRKAPLALILLAAFLAHPLTAEAQLADPRSAPEAATGWADNKSATAERFMVAAANPYAVETGREVLREGGSAADAAIAVQLVLNLVEPQSSGIGGGAFMLYWDAAGKGLTTYDARETAPASATPDRFLVDGKPMPFRQAVLSGLSIGVPGIVRLLETVHEKHGRLPWARLFEPAIALAEKGFEVSPRLNALLAADGPDNFVPPARSYFFDETGSARPVGFVLKNPEFAATLRAIAKDGSAAFYEGETAQAIVSAVNSAPIAPGGMALSDLSGYAVKERPPLCIGYRGYKVCGMGPPSSGASTVAQTLALLEPFDLGKGPSAALSPRALHLIAEAEKLAYADRDRYIGDPDFVTIPSGLLDPDYIAQRRKLIDPLSAMPPPEPGLPPGASRQSFGVDATVELPGTSHISIIDADGNAVSMTTTIESGFGSHNWAGGFLLNNELTDFSFRPTDAQGLPVANAVGPGKRPRSSMAPTIVFDPDGKVRAVLGSPGGSRIILYVLKTLVALIDWGMPPQEAADLVNFGSRGKGFEIELGGQAVWTGLKLRAFGHQILPDEMNSGIHIVARNGDRLEGAADSRREGIARGD